MMHPPPKKKFKTKKQPTLGKGMKKLRLPYTVMGWERKYKVVQSFWKTICQYILKVKI